MVTTLDVVLIVTAGLFALFSGANDGGSLLVTSLKTTSLRPLTVAALLTAMVVVAPLVFGATVASTLAGRLVSFEGAEGRLAVLVAMIGAMSVVAVLSYWGLPTSLTLALIGGILGAGVGGSLRTSWSWVALVLVIAAMAPAVGMVGAFLVSRIWGWARLPTRVGDQVRHAHRIGVVAQAFAYGTNDGQKMLAVLVLALPAASAGDRFEFPWWTLPAVAALFAAGVLLGVRRYALRLGSGVLATTPVHAVTAQLSSALAVIGSAAVGVPVSMTQALTGSLVGSGLTEGVGRIRWRQVLAVGAAWLLTLPVAGVIAALVTAIAVRM